MRANLSQSCELLILAGGFGTRLRSTVSDVPKPLAPVAGQPYLHYLIQRWIAQGVSRFTFLLHHQAELIERFLAKQKELGWLVDCEYRTLTEAQPLGTGGAIAHAVHRFRIRETFLLTNADTWLGSGLAQLQSQAAPCMAIVRIADAGRYGTVKLENGLVTDFEEKQIDAGPGWINAGMYHLHPEAFDNWDGQPYSLERDLFPKLVAAGRLNGLPLETDFIDIGVPEDYFRFCRWIKSGRTAKL